MTDETDEKVGTIPAVVWCHVAILNPKLDLCLAGEDGGWPNVIRVLAEMIPRARKLPPWKGRGARSFRHRNSSEYPIVDAWIANELKLTGGQP